MPESFAFGLDERVLGALGLKAPPSDSRLLIEFLVKEDAADAELDADGFARGIRRAVRLNLAMSAGLHRKAGRQWKEWVEETFQVGYACFNRYHVAAEIQVGLISRGLPLLTNENQSRSIATFRKHERIWDVLAGDTFKAGFPAGNELRTQLRRALGIENLEDTSSARIKLHRILWRVVRATPSGDDPVVSDAVTLVRQAIVMLEKGGVL